ncbi:MAG: helix-turn-helix transcriptional regulator [Brevundimonas sp.]|jgi:transcriptional regulator with XRE-family HTH domain|nr:helix-turn-helix transcriptional regulator [Brevundimonas sp.]
MEIANRLAERVRALRREKGWSQEELAHRAGLHRTFISQVERAVKNTTIAATEKNARALEVKMGNLLD